MLQRQHGAHRQIGLQRGLAAVVQVQDALFVAFAQHPDGVALDVGHVQVHQLGDPQAAVQEEHQDAVIPLLVFALDRVQQRQGFLQGQIPRQRFLHPRRVQFLHRIFLQQVGFAGQVAVEGTDGGDLPGEGRSVQLALSAEEDEIVVDLAQGHGADQLQIHVSDGDAVPQGVRRDETAAAFQVSEEGAQV